MTIVYCDGCLKELYNKPRALAEISIDSRREKFDLCLDCVDEVYKVVRRNNLLDYGGGRHNDKDESQS